MISVASKVAQFEDLPNYKSKSTSSVVFCAVCNDVLSSVLAYHKHNVTEHTSHELSLAIIKLCGLQLGQIFRINDNNQSSILKERNPTQSYVSNGMIIDTNFECDSLFHKKERQLNKETFTNKDTESNREEKIHSSRDEIRQEKELINNIRGTLQNQNGNEYYRRRGKNREQLCNFKADEEVESRIEDITCIASANQNLNNHITSSNNGMGITPGINMYNIQITNLTENEKYKITEKEIRGRLRKRTCVSNITNEEKYLYECNDLYECNGVVPTKGIKLEEVILRGMNDESTNNERSQDLSSNFGLNIEEEVFLQPHNYTEETIPHMSHSSHTFPPSIQKENFVQVHSNNTIPNYEHSQIMHQSENELDDCNLIPISDSKISTNYDIHLSPHSPIIEAFSTPDISLASFIFLILQNSVEGLPVSIIYALLQSLFPYFFQKSYYSYTLSDWLNLIRKTLRTEKGFRKIKINGMAYNDTVWETTSIISKYEEEIQNSSQLEDFVQSSELLNALKIRQLKFDINGNDLSSGHSRSFICHSYYNNKEQKLLSQQGEKVEERRTLKQGYTDHSEKPLKGTFNQEPFNIGPYSRYNEVENMLRLNTTSALLNDLIPIQSDLKGMGQNISAKNTSVNAHNVGILKPERKNYNCEENGTKNHFLRESQIDLLMKESFVSDIENSGEWEIDYIDVKTEPVSWCEKGGYSHQNLIYEDVECNDYIYNEKFDYINTESSNFSSESNESTFENESNYSLDNYKGREITENILEPNLLHGINCDSVDESLQHSIQQLIPCKEKDSNKAKNSSEMEINGNSHTNKKRKKKQSPIKSNEWLPRNRTKHRMNEKMRRMELNQQFDNLLKKLPDYGHRRSLPKNELLNRARKYVSKLENVNNKLLKTKEGLEEYQQKLINTLSKSK